jgi:hypothetical protein
MAIIADMKNSRYTRRGQGLAALALVSIAPMALADSLTWSAADGAWENGANWSGATVPGADDFVAIDYTGSVTSSATGNIAEEVSNHSALGIGAGKLTVVGTLASFGAVSVDGGALLDAGRIIIESGGALHAADLGTTVQVVQGIFNHGDWRMSGGAIASAESFDNFDTLHFESGGKAAANSMINHAGATATVTGAGSMLAIHGNLSNDGNLEVKAAAQLEAHSIDNKASMLVEQGRVQTDSQINDGSLEVTGVDAEYIAQDVVTNRGSVKVLAGASANIDTVDNHASFIVDGAHLDAVNFNNDTDGALTLSNGATVSLGEVLSASRFGISIDGVQAHFDTVKFQQLLGATSINGGTLGASDAFGVQIAGGELRGHGSIDGRLVVTADGLLTPGDALDASGEFDVAAGLALLGGSFAVDLGGTARDEHDVLDVHGDATLGGTLSVSLLSGYVPVLGDAFDIILADSISGAFGNILLPTLGNGLKFTTLNGGSFFRLQVAAVPLPAPAWLLCGALGILGSLSRRRL